MALKEYGIAVGKKIKAFGYKRGESQYGKWQFFNFIEKVKDTTGTWIPTQKYQVWLTNNEFLNLADGTDVEIVSISKVTFHNNEYNGKKERVCDVTCEVRVAGVQHENHKGVAGNNYIPNNNDPFGNSNETSADDLPF